MNRRSGFTLVETLVVLSAASVLLTLSTVAIHRVMLVHTHAKVFHDDEAAAWRLASAWRADVLRATDASIEREGATWLVDFTMTDAPKVSYRFEPTEVTRVEPRNNRIAQEAFPFGQPLTWRIERLNGTPASRPRLVVTTEAPADQGRRRGPAFGVNWTARLGAAREPGADR